MASGVVIQETGFTRALEMPPSFFLLSHNICWDGAGRVTVALLIDAMWDNKEYILNISSLEAPLMNEHLLVGIDVGCHSYQVAIA